MSKKYTCEDCRFFSIFCPEPKLNNDKTVVRKPIVRSCYKMDAEIYDIEPCELFEQDRWFNKYDPNIEEHAKWIYNEKRRPKSCYGKDLLR